MKYFCFSCQKELHSSHCASCTKRLRETMDETSQGFLLNEFCRNTDKRLTELEEHMKKLVSTDKEITPDKKPRFTDVLNDQLEATDITVKDQTTGLIWQREHSKERMTWEQANEYASNLDLGGHKWRLPTVDELQTLVDRTKYDPCIDSEAFPDTESSWFWTSTPYLGSAGFAWVVVFGNGGVFLSNIGYAVYVRCVRV